MPSILEVRQTIVNTNKSGPVVRKLYYSIGEVAELTGLPAHVLRYWESEFPQLKPKKGRSGNRLYQQRDLDLIMRIQKLLHEQRYTIAGAREKLQKRPQQSHPDEQQLIREIRDELKEILNILNR